VYVCIYEVYRRARALEEAAKRKRVRVNPRIDEAGSKDDVGLLRKTIYSCVYISMYTSICIYVYH